MLRDVVRFSDFWQTYKKDSPARDAIALVIRAIESRLGAQMTYDVASFPYERPDLADLFELAEKLRAQGTIKSYGQRVPASDEPPMRMWLTLYRDGDEATASGIAADDRAALTAALAESIERKIWHEETDHFLDERDASVAEIGRLGDALLPKQFSGFTDETRAHGHFALRDDAPYRWVRGMRWPEKTPVYVPAQIVSAAPRAHALHKSGEPTITYPITTGLATWPTREGAILRGMLEVIERDAFIITWLNQLTMPRLDVDALCAHDPSLAKMVARCRKYRFEPHFVRLATDAPTYAICAVVEDLTGSAPRFAHGLKAGANPAHAAESALCEALRARYAARAQLRERKPGEGPIKAEEVGHFTRLRYWAEDDRHKRLEFFHAGKIAPHDELWRHDSEAEHLERLSKWIAKRGYSCASVSLTRSRANISPWHIEFVVIPEMQPMHLREKWPYTGGARLFEVPRALGHAPREKPYLDDPHPFA